jgi:hypothetical protein
MRGTRRSGKWRCQGRQRFETECSCSKPLQVVRDSELLAGRRIQLKAAEQRRPISSSCSWSAASCCRRRLLGRQPPLALSSHTGQALHQKISSRPRLSFLQEIFEASQRGGCNLIFAQDLQADKACADHGFSLRPCVFVRRPASKIWAGKNGLS